MTTGRINQVSILSTRPETSVANNRGVKHAPLEASRPKVIESVILISSAPRTRLGLPPVSCSRNEAPSLEPTEGPPDDNQRTRNIPIRCDSIGVSRRLHRHASHSPPSSAEIGNAQGFEGSCTREIIRLAIGYRYKLLFRASIARGEEHCRLVCRAAFCISTIRGCASQPPTHSSAASLAAPGRPAAHPGTRSHPTVLQAGRNRSPWVRLPEGRSLGEEHEHARSSSYR